MGGKANKGKAKKALGEKEEQIRKSKEGEVKQRFATLFAIYDNEYTESTEENGRIQESDFPDFVRSLGICPTEAKMKELAEQCKHEDYEGEYLEHNLKEVLTPCIIDALLVPTSEYAPPSIEQLMSALQSLDLEHKGHLTEGDFRTLLSSNGDKLIPEELDPAVEEALNPATGVVDLARYAARLLYNSKLF